MKVIRFIVQGYKKLWKKLDDSDKYTISSSVMLLVIEPITIIIVIILYFTILK